MENDIIAINNVRFCYGEVCALHGVSFVLQKNALTALIGPNGGGKSTLIKLIAGLLKPDEGMIRRREAAIGYVPQGTEFDVSFPLTVLDLVLMGTLSPPIRPFFRYDEAARETARHAIERVGLKGFEGRGISELSGGQLRRAVIARVLSSKAEIIALDEPDASLDIDAARDLYAMLGTLKSDKTIVIASHHIHEVLEIADKALFVHGTVEQYEPSALGELLRGGLAI